MTPLHALFESINRQHSITICSDASVDAAKYSCCTWTIHTTEDHWHGEGLVPRNSDDNYSGQSEAFSILTAVLFLQRYINHFPGIYTNRPTPTTVYCDSETVINRILRTIRESQPLPNPTVKDDYDVYREISCAISQLTHFTFSFRHVKGHQDGQK